MKNTIDLSGFNVNPKNQADDRRNVEFAFGLLNTFVGAGSRPTVLAPVYITMGANGKVSAKTFVTTILNFLNKLVTDANRYHEEEAAKLGKEYLDKITVEEIAKRINKAKRFTDLLEITYKRNLDGVYERIVRNQAMRDTACASLKRRMKDAFRTALPMSDDIWSDDYVLEVYQRVVTWLESVAVKTDGSLVWKPKTKVIKKARAAKPEVQASAQAA